jgi:hypothetical protein
VKPDLLQFLNSVRVIKRLANFVIANADREEYFSRPQNQNFYKRLIQFRQHKCIKNVSTMFQPTQNEKGARLL